MTDSRRSRRWRLAGPASVMWLALTLTGPLRAGDLPAAGSLSSERVLRLPVPGQGFLWAHEALTQLLAAMGRWGRGEVLSRETVQAVFAADFDPRPPRETLCIRAIERGLVEHLEEQDPRLLLPLAFWQVDMIFAAQDWTGEAIPRTQDFERVIEGLEAFHDGASKKAKSAAGRGEVDRATQLAWLGIGELYLRRAAPAFLERADEGFDRALDIDPHSRVARYWSAFLREKIREPVDVLRPWRDLADDFPNDPEYRLRYGLVARRGERDRRAAEALESVARGRAPEWMRVLAYEEWVQVLLHGSDRDRLRAREILAEGRRSLPGHAGLDLLAVYLELPRARRDALRLAERIESLARPGDEGPPRIRYEFPQPDQVDEARRDLLDLLQQGRFDLVRVLEDVNPAHLFSRHVAATCRPLGAG